ncbi:Exosome complex component RRP45 [Cladochytrium tenue]|nr:Exosome complex component RRP45 [Cladochytrium tenue]
MERAAANGAFVVAALRDGVRADGRTPYQLRSVRIALGGGGGDGPGAGRAEVLLGKTRVLANVSAEVVRPTGANPNDGFLQFTTSFSPMASPAFQGGRLTDEEVLVSRMLEKALRKSRAVDTEGLCIVSGEKVWSIRIDVHVLDDDGNVVDCACIAAVAALLHFRRPDVAVDGEDVRLLSPDEKAPVPLSVHHIPICVSFSFFDGGDLLAVDASHEEETWRDGDLTVVVNAHREVCAVSHAGGAPLEPALLVRCAEVAAVKAAEMTELVRSALTAAAAGGQKQPTLQ